MKSYSLFLILAQLFLSGCGMLYRTDNSSVATLKDNEEIKINNHSKYLHVQEIRSLSIQNDSLNSFSQIEIWPKGKFDFSPGQGFSGQAEKVVIYKKTKYGSRSVERRKEAVQGLKVSDKAESKINTKDVFRKDSEKKSFRLSVWYWLLIPIALLFLWFISKYKSLINH